MWGACGVLPGEQGKAAGNKLGGRRRVARQVDAVLADRFPLIRGGDHLDLIEVDRGGREFFRSRAGERHLAIRPAGGQYQCQTGKTPALENLHGMLSKGDQMGVWLGGYETVERESRRGRLRCGRRSAMTAQSAPTPTGLHDMAAPKR